MFENETRCALEELAKRIRACCDPLPDGRNIRVFVADGDWFGLTTPIEIGDATVSDHDTVIRLAWIVAIAA